MMDQKEPGLALAVARVRSLPLREMSCTLWLMEEGCTSPVSPSLRLEQRKGLVVALQRVRGEDLSTLPSRRRRLTLRWPEDKQRCSWFLAVSLPPFFPLERPPQ